VLIVRGAGDGFVTEDLVATAVASRFGSAQTVAVDGAGTGRTSSSPPLWRRSWTRSCARGPDTAAGGWTNAFADKSADAFAATFADDVVLEASVLTRPLEGRDQVMRVMGTAERDLRIARVHARGERR
jgi:hypothetical protein